MPGHGVMAHTPPAPFDSIENAHEYVGLLCETIDDAERTIAQEIDSAAPESRHLDALRLVDYKLNRLREHFIDSRRLLTDLRTLRRYLLDERTPEGVPQTHAAARR